MIKEQLQQEQPVFFKIFTKQYETQSLSHAYLLEGRYQTKEAALYMAATIVCQFNSSGACEECSRCKRVFELNYPDVIYVDGQTTSIKKDDILKIQQRFMTSSFEKDSSKIYILDGVENATDEAMNSLLKFLEEPQGQSTIGILIAKQRNQILPTILSRCQVYRLNDAKEEIIERKAIEYGIDQEEAFFLSRLLYSTHQIEQYEQDPLFKNTIGQVKMFVSLFFQDKPHGIVYLQTQVAMKKIDRESMKIFLAIFILYCEELSIDHNRFNNITEEIINKNKKAVLHYLTTSITIRDSITRSVNIGLLVDQWGYMLMEGRS